MGTDVVLHDTLIFDGETFDPSLSTGIEANLVNSLGKRTSLNVEVVDDYLVIDVPWDNYRNAGCYGLEVKGVCNERKWSTYADALIRYTRATREGQYEVEVQSDYYDITQVVSYRYSNSPIDKVTVDIDGGYGDPTVDSTYDGKNLDLQFHNLKGNGIASVVQTTTSTEDEGVNVTTITMDNGNTAEMQVRNGSKGSNGDKGDKGDSAVFDPSTGNIATIKQSTGDDTESPMSQKAVTTEFDDINNVISLVEETKVTNFEAGYRIVSSTTGEISTSSSAGRYVNEIPVDKHTCEVDFRAVNFSGNYGYAFVKSNGTFVAGIRTSTAGATVISRAEILSAINGGATILRLTHFDNPNSPIGFVVKSYVIGKRIADMSDALDDMQEVVSGMEDEINSRTIRMDVDYSDGNRIVSSVTGDISSTASGNRYANEIDIDATMSSVSYNSPGFSGDYGYAFVEDDGTFVSGLKIATAGNVTISGSTIATAISSGATKLRLSIQENKANPVGYLIVKKYDGARLDGIEEEISDMEELAGSYDGRITALENNPIHYKVIGSPVPYISPLDTTGLTVFDALEPLYSAYDALVTDYPDWFSREEDLGMDASETYVIRRYCLRYQHPKITADRIGEGTNQWSDETYKPRRIIINMSVHSMEKFSTLGGYLAIKELLGSNEPWAMFIKSNFILDIVPCLNPWGLENGSSDNANGYNLNRTYFTNIQTENTCMINLIQELKPIGLVGVIDLHNCGTGQGYLVSKHTYKLWDYYAVLTQQVAALMYDAMTTVFGTSKPCHFHLWDSTDNGQLHQYADSQGILGCTFEIATSKGLQGSLLQKSICVNLINTFGCYE